MNTENHYQETDLGNISLNPRGEYNPEESYEYLDLVVLKGGSYVCLAENGATITGISPESGKTTQYWQVITIPGSLTPEYIAMHDRVKNLSEQVDADAEEVRTSLQEVSEIEINVSNLQEQTRQSAEAAEQSKDSSAGYAASADASRQAAEESKQNIDVQVTGFDSHVAEKTEEAENDIEAARIAANKAIIAQQEQSVNEVARAGIEAISTAQSAAQTATEKAQAADTSEKNAAASETAAKLSEENATKMAEQVATDKEQVAYDRTAVENAKQEMTGSVAQIEQNTQGISELKGDLVNLTKLSVIYQESNIGHYLRKDLYGLRCNDLTYNAYSDLIRVAGDIYFKGRLGSQYNPNGYIIFYNEVKEWIGVSSIDSGEYPLTKIELMEGTKYIRIQNGINYLDSVSVYMYNINNLLEDEYSEINFEWEDENGYIGGTSDNPYIYTKDSNYKLSKYVNVPNEIYVNGIFSNRFINNYAIHSLYAFDANKNVIGGYFLSESSGNVRRNMEKLTFPNNTAYIRFYIKCTKIDSRYSDVKHSDTVSIFYKKGRNSVHDEAGLVGNSIAQDVFLETFATFRKFGVVGDSLSVSFMQNTEDTSQIITRAIEYSWGQILARKYGNICLNFGESGISTRNWITKFSSILLTEGNKCQTYIIGLGANDISSEIGTGYGTVEDIDWNDYHNNADTLCGNYAKIIQMIHEFAPLAPIFLFTLGYPRATHSNVSSVNPTIRAVFTEAKNHIDKIYLCDLQNEYNSDYVWLNQYDQNGHFTALGYRYVSVVTNKILCETMRKNISDFGNIGFIPYGSNDVIN